MHRPAAVTAASTVQFPQHHHHTRHQKLTRPTTPSARRPHYHHTRLITTGTLRPHTHTHTHTHARTYLEVDQWRTKNPRYDRFRVGSETSAKSIDRAKARRATLPPVLPPEGPTLARFRTPYFFSLESRRRYRIALTFARFQPL